jgi:hypothetical protein
MVIGDSVSEGRSVRSVRIAEPLLIGKDGPKLMGASIFYQNELLIHHFVV